jgi:hypothetical protein
VCPSTESTDAQPGFAADVLRNLLRQALSGFPRVDRRTDDVSGVSGTTIRSNLGTRPRQRDSIIDPGPWPGSMMLSSTTTCLTSRKTSRPRLFVAQTRTTPFGGSDPLAKVSRNCYPTFRRNIGVTHTEPRLVNDDRDQPRATEPRLDGNPM